MIYVLSMSVMYVYLCIHLFISYVICLYNIKRLYYIILFLWRPHFFFDMFSYIRIVTYYGMPQYYVYVDNIVLYYNAISHYPATWHKKMNELEYKQGEFNSYISSYCTRTYYTAYSIQQTNYERILYR